MPNFVQARLHMLNSQIRTNDVTDPDILRAFKAVPRELFVPKAQRALSYSDVHINCGQDRYLMRPRDMAKMVQAAEIAPTDVVLNIAAGRGYSTAILAGLCETVVGLEDSEDRVDRATAILNDIDITNAAFVKGDLKSGAREHGPFNVIFVCGAVSAVPATWLDQLANGGRLVVVKQNGPMGQCSVYTRAGDAVGERVEFDASMPLLPGFEPKEEFIF